AAAPSATASTSRPGPDTAGETRAPDRPWAASWSRSMLSRALPCRASRSSSATSCCRRRTRRARLRGGLRASCRRHTTGHGCRGMSHLIVDGQAREKRLHLVGRHLLACLGAEVADLEELVRNLEQKPRRRALHAA